MITQTLKALRAESKQHQAQVDRLQVELSSVKEKYETLKEEVANLGIETSEQCQDSLAVEVTAAATANSSKTDTSTETL